MTPDPTPSVDEITREAGDDLATLRHLVGHHTQQLLGDTIALSDEQWREPSALPGWSRGHLGTHLARQADALVRLTTGARTGTPGQMYESSEARDADIEAGSGRSGLDLQIDLDTAAQTLAAEFEALAAADAWAVQVELRGGQSLPARLLPLARLNEVVLHHVDLAVGCTVADIPAATAEWLLEWCAFRYAAQTDLPRLELVTESGTTVAVGSGPGTRTVSGPANLLLGWLTRRSETSGLTGAEGVELPSFG